MEIDFGVQWEGRPIPEIMDSWAEALAMPQKKILGESLCFFQNRIVSFLNKLTKPSLIFGHRIWICGMLSIIDHGSIQAINDYQVVNSSLKSRLCFLPVRLEA